MKIESVDLRRVTLPLITPFVTSTGTEHERSCIIVAAHSEGISGYAECVAGRGPWYSYETTETCWHILHDFLVPLLLQVDVTDPTTVHQLFAPIRGHNMAKAALEMACWDLIARAQSLPLATLLGGTRERVSAGVSIGLQESPIALIRAVERYLADGYQRIKIKIARGRDVEDIAAVRAVHPQLLLQVDANSAYTLADTALLKHLDAFELLMIEQPLACDDILEHAVLQHELRTPLCLDESILSLTDARHALHLGSCRIINIKPGRVGGHQQSRMIHDLCSQDNIPVWCGGMLETNIGRAHNVALAALPGFSLPGDISASARYYAHDIAGPDFMLNDDSTISVPTSPGIGVEPDPAALAAATEEHISLR